MKDVTTTSFGLLIAYLLPGLVVLYGLSLWITPIASQFSVFLSAESNIGLFLLVILAAVALGLQVTAVRWLLFEKFVFRTHKLEKNAFLALGTSGKLAAFQAAVDAHYRYHQFWGGMVIVLPILFAAFMASPSYSSRAIPWVSWLVFIVFEVVSFAAASEAYVRYVDRANRILTGGEPDAERMAQEGREEGQEEGR